MRLGKHGVSAWAARLALAGALGCTENVQLLHEASDGGARTQVERPAGGRAEHCMGKGVQLRPALVDPAADAQYACGAGAQVFRHALCSCGDALFMGAFRSDGFDSSAAPYEASGPGGSVGLDGTLIGSGEVAITGSLIMSGAGQLPIAASPYTIGANLMMNGDVTVASSTLDVGGDLWLSGELFAVGAAARIAGDVYQPEGFGTTGATISGELIHRAVALEPPCACGDDERLAIAPALDAARADNDNAALGIDRAVLYTEHAGAVALPCGRFVVDGGAITTPVRLAPAGRVALYVDGDLTIGSELSVAASAEGAVDLFVGGSLILLPGAVVGAIARPSALSIYVAGAGDLVVPDGLVLGAGLYAPRSTWIATSAQTLYGSLFLESYIGSAEVALHYDRAFVSPLATGGDCAAAGSACQADIDCASPFVCREQRCVPLAD